MNQAEVARKIKIIGDQYSCRYRGEINYNMLEKEIKLSARKGNIKESYNQSIAFTREFKRQNWLNEVIVDIEKWFDFYFVKKNRWSWYNNGYTRQEHWKNKNISDGLSHDFINPLSYVLNQPKSNPNDD